MWFRRDLRLADNPALLAAVDAARSDGDGRVVPLFVIDPDLWLPAGPVRLAYLVESLRSLDASLGDALLLQHGDPVEILPEAGPGQRRDQRAHRRRLRPLRPTAR